MRALLAAFVLAVACSSSPGGRTSPEPGAPDVVNGAGPDSGASEVATDTGAVRGRESAVRDEGSTGGCTDSFAGCFADFFLVQQSDGVAGCLAKGCPCNVCCAKYVDPGSSFHATVRDCACADPGGACRAECGNANSWFRSNGDAQYTQDVASASLFRVHHASRCQCPGIADADLERVPEPRAPLPGGIGGVAQGLDLTARSARP